MRTFNDRYGQPIPVVFHIAIAERVRDRIELDVFHLESLDDAFLNPVTACQLLWAACSPQETLDDFDRRMNLQSLQDGLDAFIQALCDFLPKSSATPLREAYAELLKDRKNSQELARVLIPLLSEQDDVNV